MIFPPSTELRASLSGCHAKIPDASPFSILSIISPNTGRPGILAVCFSTKTSTTSSCSFNAKSFNSLNWSEILRTCLSLSSVDLRVYMKNFLVWFIGLKTQKGNCGYQFTLRQTDTVTHLNTQINKNAERYIELVAYTVYHVCICIGNEETLGAWN